jgi:hypothetical protein
MAKKPRRRRHVPRRTCVACRQGRPKRELIRIVRTPEGDVLVDETGKRNGRGAYLCRQRSCWRKALDQGHLARALKTTLDAECVGALRDAMADLPECLHTAPDTGDEMGGNDQT